MTHHQRPSFSLSDTTFHFVGGEPAAVLEQARAAAEGKDVRLGGGATTIREFLDVDLVDTLHVAVSPVRLARGVRLWDSPGRASGPLPPGGRAESQRRDAPPVLAPLTCAQRREGGAAVTCMRSPGTR